MCLAAGLIKSQGLGSGERSLAQPECVALNDAWGDGRCVCERKFNRCFTVSVERSASVSSEARARAPASCQHPLERRKRLRRARARRYTRHLAITLPWMCVQVAVSSCTSQGDRCGPGARSSGRMTTHSVLGCVALMNASNAAALIIFTILLCGIPSL